MRKLVGILLAVVLFFAPLVYGAEAEKVDINTASETELLKLPGIGTVIAKRVIEYREAHGGFETVEEIIKVKGIGNKKLEKMRTLITTGDTKEYKN